MKNIIRGFVLNSLLLLLSVSILAQDSLLFTSLPRAFKGHRTSVNDLKYNSDCSELYSCGGNNQIIVFNVNNGDMLRHSAPLGNEIPINKIDLNFNEELLAWETFNGDKVTICSPTTFEMITEITGFSLIGNILFSPIENIICITGLTSNDLQIVATYDAISGEQLKLLYNNTGATYPSSIDYSANGKYIVCGFSEDNQGIKVWDASTGEEVLNKQHQSDIDVVKFSPNGQLIAGGSFNSNIYIWELKTKELVKSLSGLAGNVACLDFSPNGKYIAAAGGDYNCTFITWEVESGNPVQSVGGKSPDIFDVEFSCDGESLAVAYRTYGNLFDAATINIFSTAKGISQIPWFKVSSDNSGLELDFPNKVTEDLKSTRNYDYYDYFAVQPSCAYFARATKYLYDINDEKRKAAIEKKAASFATNKTLVKQTNFEYNGITGIDSKGYNGVKRYHQRLIFIDNVLYQISFTTSDMEENVNEPRFFNSFSIK
jgi:WD40 repeat protein